MGNSISAYVQVYKQQRAVFEALKSFRTHYRDEPVTVLSDDGDDFSRMSAAFDARYIHSGERVVTGPELRTTNLWPLEGTYAWFDRLYEHCVSFDTDWVLFLTSGTRTIRRVRSFPDAPIVGARSNPFSPDLTNHLVQRFGPKNYVYGCSGGGIFSRAAFMEAYQSNRNLDEYIQYDQGVDLYSDLAFGLLFFVNGFEYSEWDEVSEIFHEGAPIIRDSAFDHGYKYWYGRDFDERLLDSYRYVTVKEFDENFIEQTAN